ncbi:hypothetical protein C8R43DRAFT_1228711 [Mycena crocata]|nr:hypothetical protein C8R43DRAFT_1228711 [Mycena crocata]
MRDTSRYYWCNSQFWHHAGVYTTHATAATREGMSSSVSLRIGRATNRRSDAESTSTKDASAANSRRGFVCGRMRAMAAGSEYALRHEGAGLSRWDAETTDTRKTKAEDNKSKQLDWGWSFHESSTDQPFQPPLITHLARNPDSHLLALLTAFPASSRPSRNLRPLVTAANLASKRYSLLHKPLCLWNWSQRDRACLRHTPPWGAATQRAPLSDLLLSGLHRPASDSRILVALLDGYSLPVFRFVNKFIHLMLSFSHPAPLRFVVSASDSGLWPTFMQSFYPDFGLSIRWFDFVLSSLLSATSTQDATASSTAANRLAATSGE